MPNKGKVFVGFPTRRSRSALQRLNVCILARVRRYPVPAENLVWPITASRRAHVTCYTASLHLVDFKCASSFGEAQPSPPLCERSHRGSPLNRQTQLSAGCT